MGLRPVWGDLPIAGRCAGVGGGTVTCSRKVNLVGAFHAGRLLAYEVPVLDITPPSPQAEGLPPLYGLSQLADDNTFFCSKTGRMHMLPDGVGVDDVKWPQQIRIIHRWLLGMEHWDKVPQSEIKRVQAIRSGRRIDKQPGRGAGCVALGRMWLQQPMLLGQ